ncbi:MAG: hypothetical protein ACREQ5_15200 [Candidatus Dormibacteria bacterium]
MIAALSLTTLGWLTGILFGIVVFALVVSLLTVWGVLASIGGGPTSHLASVGESLGRVAENTDPVPPTLLAINDGLAALAKEMHAVAGHLQTARAVFDGYADGRMG